MLFISINRLYKPVMNILGIL